MGASQADAARTYRVSRQAVSRWWAAFEAGGIRNLGPRRATGRPPRIPRAVVTRVLLIAFANADARNIPISAWTVAHIRRVLWEHFGIRYQHSQVWKLLHSLGWNPRSRKASRRDDLLRWLSSDWPRLSERLRYRPAAR